MVDLAAPPPSAPATGRIRSLDGLRGLAAATVVLGHTRLVVLQNYDSPLFDIPLVSQALGLLGTLGAHAVWLFFILSGMVLSRMMIGAREFDYGQYVLGRAARLYLPVWGAVALTVILVLLVSRDSTGLGAWVDGHPGEYAPWAIASDLTLVSGTTANLSPLWSLQWEVLFSLLLIVYVTVLRRVPPVVGILAGIALSALGQRIGNPLLMYMPMFAIGTSLAFAWPSLTALHERLRGALRGGRVVRALVAVLIAAVILILQVVPPLLSPLKLDGAVAQLIGTTASLAGLTLAVVSVGLVGAFTAAFQIRPVQWLGTVSFSLYLVHEPLLLALVYLFHAAPLAIVAGVAVSFAGAQVFYLLVEKPSHRIARRFRPSASDVLPQIAEPSNGAQPSR